MFSDHLSIAEMKKCLKPHHVHQSKQMIYLYLI